MASALTSCWVPMGFQIYSAFKRKQSSIDDSPACDAGFGVRALPEKCCLIVRVSEQLKVAQQVHCWVGGPT